MLVVTVRERLIYMCNHSKTNEDMYFWTINASRLSVDIFPLDIFARTLALSGGGRVSTLTIGGHLEHNDTTIQCSAILTDGSKVNTPTVKFLVQGTIILQDLVILIFL